MKKILFSFLSAFCLLITVNSCQAKTISFPNGVEQEVDDKYSVYCVISSPDYSNDYDYFIAVSEIAGTFKLLWKDSKYYLAFYPDGSSNYKNYVAYGYRSTDGYVMTFSNMTMINTYNNFSIQESSDVITYASVNPNGSEQVGDVFFQPPAQVEKGVLTQVLEKEIQNNPKLVLEQIAVILIPILVAVVCFLGFRKAWQILRTSLNNA